MRITALETIRLASRANLLWVRVHTDEGLVGLGETFRGAAAVEAFLHASVAPMLVGRDPLAIDAIAKLLTEPYLGFRSSGVEMRAASAVDIALWDLAGKAAGMPVWQLLGGLTRESIRTYNTCAGYAYNASGGRREIGAGDAPAGPYDDQVAFERDAGELAQGLLAEGITAMKIWPFDRFAVRSGGNFISSADIARGMEPFERIRRAVGDRMDVMVEFHSMWDLPSALAIARPLRDIRPYWSEDPVKMLDAAALQAYAERSGLPVCASETIAGRAHYLELLRRDCVDYVMPDISWCGGLGEAKKIATLAEAFQRPIAPHDCTGPVVFMASTHLALNAPNAVFQESVRAYYTTWYRDLVTELPRVEDGHVHAPRGTGLCTELLPDIARRPDAIVRRSA
ncbi:MAG: mandelate racemase/muconate lactonizing enzyme family protein [Alphaproteobacteria bacterium]